MCKKIFVVLFIFFCIISLLNLNKVSAKINVKPVIDGGGVCRHTYVNKPLPKYIKSYATCTSPAVYYKSCSKCGSRGTGTFTSGSVLGHQLSTPRWTTNLKSAATCTSPAVYSKYCLRCRKNVDATFTYGKALGHSLSTPRLTTNLKSAATCTSPAVYYKYCQRCKKNVEQTFTYGEALQHNYKDGICTRCNKESEFRFMAVLGDEQARADDNALTKQTPLTKLTTKDDFNFMPCGEYGSAQNKTVETLNKKLNTSYSTDNSDGKNVLMGYSHGGQIVSKLIKYNPGKNTNRAVEQVDDIFLLDGVDFQMSKAKRASDRKAENNQNATNYLNGLFSNVPAGTKMHIYASNDSDRSISQASRLTIETLENMSINDPNRVAKNENGEYDIKDKNGNTIFTIETHIFNEANHGNLCVEAAEHMADQINH